MKNRKFIKTTAVLTAIMLAVTTVGCAGTKEKSSDGAESVINAEDVSEKLAYIMNERGGLNAESSTQDKVETVYVTADATGAVGEIIVSNWLKNPSGEKEITDNTILSDIVNVKGKETYALSGNGDITWDAEGRDIYYQGVTDKELPVTVKVSYTLDGKTIEPSELAGKSGNVTIRFDYENNFKQKINIEDKEYEVYTPFAMISGLMLDSSKFSDVEVSNGKIISDANNYIVLGMALPGLKDSLSIDKDKLEDLDIDDEDIEIPEYFEVSAYTNGFELGMTMTMASSDILSSLGLDELSDSDAIDEIRDKLDELNDGGDELNDGAHKLKDGTSELRSGALDLNDGVKELSDGAKELKDGTDELYSGIVEYTDGASELYNGTATLANGVNELKNGSAKLRAGFNDNDITGNAKKLADGAGQVSSGVNALVSQLGGLSSSVADLDAAIELLNGVSQLMDNCVKGIYTNNTSVCTPIGAYGSDGAKIVIKNGLGGEAGPIDDATYAYYSGVLKQFTDYTLDDCAEFLAGYYTELHSSKLSLKHNPLSDAITKYMNTKTVEVRMSMYASENDADKSGELSRTPDEQGDDASEDTPGSAGSDENDVDSEDNADEAENNSGNNGEEQPDIADDTKDGSDIEEEGEEAEEDTEDEEPEDGEAEDDEEITAPKTKVLLKAPAKAPVNAKGETNEYKCAQVVGACKSAVITIELLKGKLSALTSEDTTKSLLSLQSGASQVAAGASKLSGGLGEIGSGINQLDDGIGTLQSGAGELYDGAGTLVSNNSKLVSGVFDLNDGAFRLYDGTVELYDGVNDLKDGTAELDDGAGELLDGIIKLDEEGIKKIYEAFDGDLSDFYDRLKAIKEAGESYTSYAGAAKDMESSVKFIIKTDSIK